ncbi:hypothetical protein LSAT2_030910 [Lamellibrachia satsuma]|nr:hypothetical protein LSAT2_030910 [Lamellibrachia satsuma]
MQPSTKAVTNFLMCMKTSSNVISTDEVALRRRRKFLQRLIQSQRKTEQNKSPRHRHHLDIRMTFQQTKRACKSLWSN